MSDLAYKLDEAYTYADYLRWDDSTRYEIVDGIAFMMASPSMTHQAVIRELLGTIWEFLKGQPCQVFAAPFDVRLFPREDDSDTTVVQPDIMVICDKSKLSDGKACKGAPDLVIEILSPSTALMDINVKAKKYQKAGVREYWIVDTGRMEVQVNLLDNGSYTATMYRDLVPSAVLPGLTIDLKVIKANVY